MQVVRKRRRDAPRTRRRLRLGWDPRSPVSHRLQASNVEDSTGVRQEKLAPFVMQEAGRLEQTVQLLLDQP